MEELGQSVQPNVSRQAINKYEKGQSMPDSRMLISLGMALGVKPDYFFRPFTVEVDKVMFRKKSRFSEKDALAVKGNLNAIWKLNNSPEFRLHLVFSTNRLPMMVT